MPDLIHATITGFDRCDAGDHTVRAAAPVLAMCRKLLAAGHDPARPLHAYRGDTLALKVRSIGEGAKLTVKDNSCRDARLPSLLRWGRNYAPSLARSLF